MLLGVVRPWMKRRFAARPEASLGTAAYVGRSAFVIDSVTQHGGRVKLGGETWSASRATPSPIEPGRRSRRRIDGATAVVTRVPTLGTSDAP